MGSILVMMWCPPKYVIPFFISVSPMLLVLTCCACQPCSTLFTLHMPVYCTLLSLCLPFNWHVLLYVPCTCRITIQWWIYTAHMTFITWYLSSLSASQFGATSFKASSIIYHVWWVHASNNESVDKNAINHKDQIELISPPFNSISQVCFSASHPDHLLVSAWDMVCLVLAQCFLERRKGTHMHILPLTHDNTRLCSSMMSLQTSKRQNLTIEWQYWCVLSERVQGHSVEGLIMEYASVHLYLDFCLSPCWHVYIRQRC